MKILKQSEIEAIANLTAKKRYEYFIKQVADQATVWGLFNSDWVILKDKEGNELFPVWPHRIYSELFLKENLIAALPKAIDIYDFLENFLPKLGKNNTTILVFPTPKNEGFIGCYSQLYNDLNEEFSKY